MTLRHLLIATAIAAAPVILTLPASAGSSPVYTGTFSNTAIQGNDPVAYFTEGKPVEGKKQFSTDYNGAEFRFASAENLATFMDDPEKYAPQYGGYCAWAIADGKLAKGNANNWKIVDGKLYLNYNDNIQEKWNADIDGFIARGNEQWPTVLN